MNMYYPGATFLPGPPASVYPGVNAVTGVIAHSADGQWSAGYTPVDTMRQQGTSWQFSIMEDGQVFQHYPLTSCCWHAGSEAANRRLVGVEHEGFGIPLMGAQVASSVGLTRWVAQQGGWRLERALAGRTLWEHHEINPATNCPSGRIPWGEYVEAFRTLPLDLAETLALFRDGIATHIPEIFTDNGGAAELIVGGYAMPPGQDAYVVRIPKGSGR